MRWMKGPLPQKNHWSSSPKTCTLSLSSYQSPMLIVDNQGVAQRAHPNRRERWILKCTKLRQGICLANNWFTYWILPHPICLPSKSKGHDNDCRLRSMKHRVAQLLIWIILSYIMFVHLWPWYHLWFSMINPAEVKQDLKTVASGGKKEGVPITWAEMVFAKDH